jgi:non-specific protein-tyrosine kinase
MDEPTTPFSEDLRRYLSLLLHWAWLLALATLLAGGAAYGISSRMTPVYRASTLVLINEAPGARTADYTALMASERLARTYAEVMTTRPVLEGVSRLLDLPEGQEVLPGAISVQPVRDTQLNEIQVEDTHPGRAALIANALVAEFAAQNREEQASRFAASKQNLEAQMAQVDGKIEEATGTLGQLEEGAERERLESALAQYQGSYYSLLQSYEEVRLAEAQSLSTIVQKEAAIPPALPVRPRTMTNTLLAAVVGLMAAVGLVFLFEALDDTLRDPAEAARQLGLPVLGLVARHAAGGRPEVAERPRSPVAESFRGLRTNLQFASLDRPLRTLLVTSPAPEEGKSTVAANLAVVLAQGGFRVVLIDADLRRPSLHRILGLPNREGLSSLFLQRQAYEGRLNPNYGFVETGEARLSVLTSGSLPPNPAELLGSESMRLILEQASQTADVVVIDSPPVLAVTDAAVLAPRVDGVLLVVKPGATKLPACQQAVEQLRRVGGSLLGLVLNDVNLSRTRHTYYQYRGYQTAYDYRTALPPANGRRNGKLPHLNSKEKTRSA